MSRRRKPASRERAAAKAPAQPRAWLPVVLAFALVLAIGAVYWPVSSFDFVNFDDGVLIAANPHVTTGLTVANVQWAFTHPYVGSGGPLTWLSHMLDVELFGVRPGPPHVENVFWHAYNGVLLLALLVTLTGQVWKSALVAALFALHPLNVEPVTWIAQRKDVLSTLFLLLTIWAYAAWAADPRPRRYALLGVLFVAGLLTKPMLVTLPALLVLLDYWPLGRSATVPLSRRVTEKLPLLLPVLGAAVMTLVDQGRIGALSSLDALPLSARLANAVVSYVAYLEKAVWPVRLTLFYPYREHVPLATAAACVALLLGVSALAWWLRGRVAAVSVGWA